MKLKKIHNLNNFFKNKNLYFYDFEGYHKGKFFSAIQNNYDESITFISIINFTKKAILNKLIEKK